MKKFRVTVNGKVYEVEVEEMGAVSLAPVQVSSNVSVPKVETAPPPPSRETASVQTPKVETPKPATAPSGGTVVSAPMPGKVLSVNVKEGDKVNEGDLLLILEAMKMENEILAPVGGVVKQVKVAAGGMVNTGDAMVVIG